jgi:hypothetical protein
MTQTIASGLNRVLHRKVSLKPIVAVVLFALVYAVWFPLINTALQWRPHRIASFAGHEVDVPFLWYEDSQANFTIRHPSPSIFDPLDNSIDMTRTNLKNTDEAASYQRRWLYMNGLAPKPANEDARQSAREDQIRLLIAPLGEYKLTPDWSCARLTDPIRQMIWLQCLSKDSTYILRYHGRPAYLQEFKRVAEQIEGPGIPQHVL